MGIDLEVEHGGGPEADAARSSPGAVLNHVSLFAAWEDTQCEAGQVLVPDEVFALSYLCRVDDPAREVVFPKGVPIVHMETAKKSKLTSEGYTGAASPEEETTAATIGEGNLSNEVTEVGERSKGNVPEASENLLKE